MKDRKSIISVGRWANPQRLLCMAMLMLFTLAVHAQNAVTGKVVDNTGEAIMGATVQVKNTKNVTVTDLDGNFTLQNVAGNAVLVAKYIGYKTQEVALAGKRNVTITLEEDSRTLSEVVVVGYGVQRKSDVTGAMVRVGEDQLNTKPVNNAFEALQGKAAGVDITSSQRPGTIGDIRIRGNRSLNASNSPLYVVDGVPLDAGGIETLNPHDIESIDILKDASSTAIYGSRGANGVVLVTTKRGKSGSMALTYNGSVTFEKIHDLSPAMKASDYITWRRWAYHNSNPTKFNAGDNPDYTQDQTIFAASGDNAAYANVMKGWNDDHTVWDGSKVTDTDWTDLVSRTGITTEHSLRASGGNEKFQGAVSFGFLNNTGTQKGQSYKRYNFSTSIDLQATPWFKMGASINSSYGIQQYGYSRTGQSSNSGPTDIYGAAKAIPRFAVPYDENGEIIYQPAGSTTNVYTVIDEWNKSTDERQTFRTLGSFYAQLDFSKIWAPLDGLQYKIAFGPDFRYYRQGIFLDSQSAVRVGGSNYATRTEQRHFSWTLDNMILYNKKFGDHNIGVTLLQSASKYNRENGSMHENNVLVSAFKWNNMGLIDISDSKTYGASMSTGLVEKQLSSYMARVNYSFMDRYLLTVSGRYDGSSVLAPGNKWAFFPSAALGWRIDQEDFMKDIKWIDQLKVRLGAGTTGNAAVDAYSTLGVLGAYWMPFSTGNQMVFVTNEPYYTSGSNKMPNKNLKWEKTTQYNFGVDFSVLKGRIGGTIDIYTSRTSDLLMTMTLPTLSGYPSMLDNVGKTKNWGIDITLNAVPVKTNGFEWNTILNAAYQHDEIVELANGKEDDINNAWFIGKSIGVYYAYDNAGLWQERDAEEMAKFNDKGAKFQVGMVRPVDQNGDYVIDSKDKIILGNTSPRWTLGWSNTFSYKGLELAVELYGRFKYMVNTGGQGQYGMYNQNEISYWTPSNTGADYQKPIYSTSGGDAYSSLLGYKNANFIKLRNLSLGYVLPKSLCQSIGISNAKVYIQGKNLGCLYTSVDEIDLDLGTSYYNRGFTMGLQVGF